MWSLFSRDPTSSFVYEVGPKLPDLNDKSVWSLHEGKHKTTGEIVTVFSFDLKASSESQSQLAKAAFKRLKTLRHPNILTYVDGLETDKVLYIVTEKIVPLESYLTSDGITGKQSELSISWGLHQIAKALSFLVNNVGLIHNNVNMGSIFVDRAGEWKLGGVDYMYSADGNAIPPTKILPALERYDPPEKSAHREIKQSEKWSADMWGLGCLIWEVFNGTLPKTSELKSTGKIPKSLLPNYCELVGANPRSRPNPAKFIESCRSNGGFMDNQFVKCMLFLEEIQIKEQTEKLAFFKSLPPVLDTFPPQACQHKILPQLLVAFEYGNAGSAVLNPLFKLGKQLSTEEYQKKIVPCVVKLFSSTDRATRVHLLEQMEQFIEHLTPDVVNNSIFANVCQGFTDTNPRVREVTIKAMVHLASKLNYKNLNEELLKQFARLQTKDDQGGIRTNTTVCLGKIAPYLNPQSRQKILISAFTRALKDPFPPSREAGVLAIAACHQYFTLAESAARLLPALTPVLIDPEKTVRDKAFKSVKCFLGKLEKCSENPELQAEMEKDVLSGNALASAGSWSGWAMSGMSSLTSITSKIYKSKGSPGKSASPSKPPGDSSREMTPEGAAPSEPAAELPSKVAEPEMEDTGGSGWEDEGWKDDDWGDMDQNAGGTDSTTAGDEEVDQGDGWDDDDWGSLEDTTPKPETKTDMRVTPDPSPWGHKDFSEHLSQNTTAAYNWGDPNSDDFFTGMVSKKEPKKTLLSMSSQKAQSPTSSHSSRSSDSPQSRVKASESTSSRTKASEPASSRAKVSESTFSKTKASESASSGWDDSGWDAGESWDGNDYSANNKSSSADADKDQREEKKQQRLKELQEKRAAKKSGLGAMKLGSKKVSMD